VLRRNFWGTEVYTSDSDPVCILQHSGQLDLTDDEPTNFEGLSAYFRVMKGKNNYPASLKNQLKSRKMGQYEGHSIKLEKVEFLVSMGSVQELSEMVKQNPIYPEKECNANRKNGNSAKCAAPDIGLMVVSPAVQFNLSLELAFEFNLA